MIATARRRRLARWLAVAASCALAAPLLVAQDLSPGGTIRIGVLKNGSYEIVTLPLETYVARVLTGEALPGSEPAALQALAVAIRTYTVENRARHRAEGFDLCDQTHCQVMRASTAVTERAALATAGRVLLYHGEPATVYYSASCGGRTEKPSNVWPGSDDPPYLPSRADDDGCGGSPEWNTELSLGDLQRAFRAFGFNGTLRSVRVGGRNESGRVAKLTLDGMSPGEISGQDLRAAVGRTLGWQYVQSAAFELVQTKAGVRFEGHGAGHGVGMCVIGSTRLALAGRSYADILRQYYPGTEIGTSGPRMTAVPPPKPTIGARPSGSIAAAAPLPVAPAPADLALSLPEGDEGERTSVMALVRRERDGLAKTLGVDPPGALTVRLHPTTDDFERVTKRPWFELGATTGTELHFIPIAVLRERGILERTVRHQLAHAMIDPVLPEHPAWIREGAARHFADGGEAPSTRAACPADAELLGPVSVGAYTDAVTRARACFERELKNRKWRDVRGR